MQSHHNILTPVKDSSEFLIVNPLYGSADLISPEEKEILLSCKETNPFLLATQQNETLVHLREKGYVVDEAAEKKAFRLAYLDFLDRRDQDEIQLFFVPNYSCNFACSYCYQEGYESEKQELSTDVIDAFFDYIRNTFAGKRTYITVFGGEPLLPGNKQRTFITYLLNKASEAQLDVAFVTNGYTLSTYVSLFKQHRIREVQVTLDGTEEIHNSRRYLKGKNPTFETIVQGIDACLDAQIQINLRMVIDKDNLGNLPEMARYAIQKKWTESPYFKTQLGRNYELHHCNSSPERLFSRAALYAALYDLMKTHPHIAEFHKPAFSMAKHLSETGELPLPLFDACPACKTEWAFDYTGTIYSCTATVGKQGEALGRFYPTAYLNEAAVNDWQERDVTSIEACKSCHLALACGGGCGSVAKNKNGSIQSPDCRPITELLSLGAAYYLNQEA